MAELIPEFQSVIDHFTRHNVPMDVVDKKRQMVHFTCPGPIECRVIVSGDGGAMMFRSVFCDNSPPARLAAVAEVVTRINEELHAGCFSLDWADGQVVFKSTQWLTGPVPDEIMMRFVGGSIKTVERFRDAIISVMDGAPPEESARSAFSR